MFRVKLSLALIATVFSAVSANPVPAALDIFDPRIITPDASTVWQVGSLQNVTWDASNPPASISNGASIVLRTANINGVFVTLASGFSLLAGVQEVQVPADIPTGNDYEIVLFGDSGDISPQFTIIAN
ncbi:hypothetical protein M422DRAFT_216753 [Sphaerobolus stellatus SS14]|uniref:Yeast cell wall synthesis Kre9/Knh1-like N-terminal domain-containing protein n=1 Tax=Sphaerobolus stellatus (strain SS14) TaxID=990650 RepID=A0A0C9TUK4_SPHS4|nr:hypothetical protein M422DRAFT_216753 [Sphaerobolus stellatus SS14]